MRLLILTFFILTVSCGRTSDKDFADSSKPADDGTFHMVTNSFEDINYHQVDMDSIELKHFWFSVVQPILLNEKEKVLSTIDFPLSIDQNHIMVSEKNSNLKNHEDFAKLYDKFFNSAFHKSLSSHNYRDIQVGRLRDTVWYTIYIGRPLNKTGFEVGMSLDYFKDKSAYKLKIVRPIAGDFYDIE